VIVAREQATAFQITTEAGFSCIRVAVDIVLVIIIMMCTIVAVVPMVVPVVPVVIVVTRKQIVVSQVTTEVGFLDHAMTL